jgi:hypothetical protein
MSFLVDGDIGCCHRGAKRLIPWRGLDGLAQAKTPGTLSGARGSEIQLRDVSVAVDGDDAAAFRRLTR